MDVTLDFVLASFVLILVTMFFTIRQIKILKLIRKNTRESHKAVLHLIRECDKAIEESKNRSIRYDREHDQYLKKLEKEHEQFLKDIQEIKEKYERP